MSINEQIDRFGMVPDLAAALREVIAQHGPEVDFQPGYISVRPAERYIAAYFNKSHVDIAVNPHKADSLSSGYPGTRVQPKKTSTTAYIRVPAKTLASDSLLELVAAALTWREAGARWSGEMQDGFAADLAGETCQTCNVTIAKNGSCWCD